MSVLGGHVVQLLFGICIKDGDSTREREREQLQHITASAGTQAKQQHWQTAETDVCHSNAVRDAAAASEH